MEPSGTGPYVVHLLCESKPRLEQETLRLPNARPMGPQESPDFAAFACEGLTLKLRKRDVPVQIQISTGQADRRRLEEALVQTRDWPAAREIVRKQRAAVSISDFFAAGLDRATRLRLIHGAVRAALEVVPGLAILWAPAERVIDPAAYRAAEDPLWAAINVRCFEFPDGTLMDTMGLAALGLPDVQCRFRGADPNGVARVLVSTAYYLFEKGDVIGEGDTVEGAKPGERWRCRRETSSARPDRPVVEVNPRL